MPNHLKDMVTWKVELGMYGLHFKRTEAARKRTLGLVQPMYTQIRLAHLCNLTGIFSFTFNNSKVLKVK